MSYTPSVPTGLNVSITSGLASISWNPSSDSDFDHFEVYRGNRRIYTGTSTSCADQPLYPAEGRNLAEAMYQFGLSHPTLPPDSSELLAPPVAKFVPGTIYWYKMLTVNTSNIRSGMSALVSGSYTDPNGIIGE